MLRLNRELFQNYKDNSSISITVIISYTTKDTFSCRLQDKKTANTDPSWQDSQSMCDPKRSMKNPFLKPATIHQTKLEPAKHGFLSLFHSETL